MALYVKHSGRPERGRHSAAIGRILKRQHVRGLIMKVSRTRRWRATENGRRVLGHALQTYRRYHAQAGWLQPIQMTTTYRNLRRTRAERP